MLGPQCCGHHLSTENKANITFRDPGTSSEYRLKNTDQSMYYETKMDCTTTAKSCDNAIDFFNDKVGIIIELKGVQYEKSINQLKSTFDRLKPRLSGYTIHARSVCKSVPAAGMQKKGKEFLGHLKMYNSCNTFRAASNNRMDEEYVNGILKRR